jgi:hypothetical protein
VAPPAAPAAPAAPTTTPIRTDKDGFVLPAGHFSVQELIDAAARFLQRNILYSEMEMPSAMAGGFFHFQKELALDALGCEEVLGQLLYLKGYALLELDAQKKIYEVVFMGGQRAREVFTSALRRTPEEILQRPRLKQVVFTEVKLEHINANIATNALRPFFAIGAGPAASIGPTFGTAGSNSVILISGFQDQVAQMIQLLRACDVTGPEVPADVNERIMRLEQTVQQLQQQRDEGKPAGK